MQAFALPRRPARRAPSRPPVRRLPALLAALVLAGCASPPAVRWHSLLEPEPPAAAARPAAAGWRLSLAPVAVPPALDQPQWLVRRADDTLQTLEQDRWAGPLGDELWAALREAMVARWGAVDARQPVASAGGAADTGAAAPPPPLPTSWRVTVELLRLDAWPARDTLLDARWTLQPPSGATASCTLRVREPVSGEGTVPLAAAHRRAVARLADEIGRQQQAMARGAGPACVAPPVAGG
ncbi:PqiC family protein [Piscinibacter sakaiensis]|uniref:PqiC family protein n=1 Tax=Piscinibacter sakaiensis TaxID=1547922 RepID=UPI0018CFF9E9|nr:PqiC family protein [Piscinibacter sakaiensis]